MGRRAGAWVTFLALFSVSCGCGRADDARGGAGEGRSPPTADDPGPAGAPLATYRLATTRSPDGDSLTLEASAPCRVLLDVVRGSIREGGRSRDLEPGDVVRIAWSVAPVVDAPRDPAPTEGRGASEVAHRLRYSLDDVEIREAILRMPTTASSPWVRTAVASPPVSPKPFPAADLALVAIGVADLATHAGLSLVLEPTPAIVGAPEGTPATALHLAFLRLRVAPR